MEGATRIDDLPDNISMSTMGMGGSQYSTENMDTAPSTYAPMNNHPNPYGQGPPQQTAIQMPVYTKNESKSNAANLGGFFDPTMMQQTPNYPLPQRDIPMDMSGYVQDDAIKANYIPPPSQKNGTKYVEDQEARIRRQPDGKRMAKRVRLFSGESWTWEDLFIELQEPIIVAILFLLFQIANINQHVIQKYFSFLQPFHEDGITLNFNGYLFKSVLFGLAYFAFNQMKVM